MRTILVVQSCLSLLLFHRWRPAIFLAATVAGTAVANTLIKKIVRRQRPRTVVSFRHDTESFPSGHTSGTTALFGAWSYIAWQLTRRSDVTAAAALCAGALSGLTGYSRIRLHQHHTSDVVAGHALGAACLLVAAAVDHAAMRSRSEE